MIVSDCSKPQHNLRYPGRNNAREVIENEDSNSWWMWRGVSNNICEIHKPEEEEEIDRDYEEIVGRRPLEYMELLAENVTGSVQHINATYTGGGVAEILSSLVPLFNGLDVDTEWSAIRGDDKFYSVTKSFHNALHGSLNGVIDVCNYDRPVSTPKRRVRRMRASIYLTPVP